MKTVENVEAAARRERENFVGDFVWGIAFYFGAALDAEGLAAAGEKQAQVIVNFGGSSYG